MQHIARLPVPGSGLHDPRMPVRRETIFAVLADLARRLSEVELATLAVAAGLIPLVAAATGYATWMLLAGCYVVWCFASWGIFFGPPMRYGSRWRTLELLIVGSATAVFVVLSAGVFFWALGSHWQL